MKIEPSEMFKVLGVETRVKMERNEFEALQKKNIEDEKRESRKRKWKADLSEIVVLRVNDRKPIKSRGSHYQNIKKSPLIKAMRFIEPKPILDKDRGDGDVDVAMEVWDLCIGCAIECVPVVSVSIDEKYSDLIDGDECALFEFIKAQISTGEMKTVTDIIEALVKVKPLMEFHFYHNIMIKILKIVKDGNIPSV